jgi:HAD superfamily hydrolase (TIGR01509 family)
MAFTILKPERLTGPVQGVLFDMDGVVLDSEKLYTRFWIEAAAHFGYTMTWEQALRLRGASKPVSAQILRGICGQDADYPQIRAMRNALLQAYIDEFGLETKAGIRELLDCLEELGIPAAITSSSPPDRIQEQLTSVGLYHRFTAICSGYNVPNGKPAPDIYLYAAEKLNLPPGECIALEDSQNGIRSAHAAGCMTVMVPDLDQPAEEIKPLLFDLADGLEDVIRIIESV